MKKCKFKIFKKNLWKFRRKCLKKDCGIFWLPKKFFKTHFSKIQSTTFGYPLGAIFYQENQNGNFENLHPIFFKNWKLHRKILIAPTPQNYSGNFIFAFLKISSRFCADFDRLQNHFWFSHSCRIIQIQPGANTKTGICSHFLRWPAARLQTSKRNAQIIYWLCAELQNLAIYYSNPERIKHQYKYILLFYLSYIGLIWPFCA